MWASPTHYMEDNPIYHEFSALLAFSCYVFSNNILYHTFPSTINFRITKAVLRFKLRFGFFRIYEMQRFRYNRGIEKLIERDEGGMGART